MIDYETRWEEKANEMLEILKKFNFSEKREKEIEEMIFTDQFYSFESLREFLKKEKKKVGNY